LNFSLRVSEVYRSVCLARLGAFRKAPHLVHVTLDNLADQEKKCGLIGNQALTTISALTKVHGEADNFQIVLIRHLFTFLRYRVQSEFKSLPRVVSSGRTFTQSSESLFANQKQLEAVTGTERIQSI